MARPVPCCGHLGGAQLILALRGLLEAEEEAAERRLRGRGVPGQVALTGGLAARSARLASAGGWLRPILLGQASSRRRLVAAA